MLKYVVEKASARDVSLELEEICCHNSLDNFQESSTEQPVHEETKSIESKEYYKYYLPLYNASLCANWEKAKTFLTKDNEASQAHITSLLQTALHIAIGSKKNDNTKFFIENLVNSMTNDDALAIKDSFGETPLHYAARFGYLDVTKILVTRNSNLPHIVSNTGLYPIHLAVEYGYKYVDMVYYFFSITKDSAVYAGRSGARLLHRLICSDLYDFASQLVKSSPDLAKYSSNGSSPLALLATKTFGTSRVRSSKPLSSPEWKQQNAIKLAECLCENLQSLSNKEINSIVGGPLLQAARFNNYKLVEIIVKNFPSSIYYCNKRGRNILHVAVENRCTNVYNLVCQMNQHRHHLMTSIDSSNNTVLHLAGKLTDETELNYNFGAALKMQEELRWFEAVKQMLPPSYYERSNNKGKTAHQVFIEQHSNLKIQGEKWMKNTASPCAMIAALIVTIACAASTTFPGIKKRENALPNSYKNGFFFAFAFSNTVSLSTSCISLFAFISLLTARYAEEDFLHVFPKRLLCGLLTLYASVEAMMLSFGCALYFLLDNEMVFCVAFIIAVLPILAFQHWRGPLINHLVFVIKRKKTML